MNQLILGHNLEILKKLDSASVDLVYLDPPFFSNRNYEVIWGDENATRNNSTSNKFKHGQHSIVYKMVDNDGLENVAVFKLKVYGVVEQGLRYKIICFYISIVN